MLRGRLQKGCAQKRCRLPQSVAPENHGCKSWCEVNFFFEDGGLEMLADEAAEALAIFVFHVDKFDAVTVGAEVADDGSEVDFLEAAANFQLDGIADAQPMGGF